MATWAYGITTVPSRQKSFLVQTVWSLIQGGFHAPRLFVDGEVSIDKALVYNHFRDIGCSVTFRIGTAIGVAGNWTLAMMELYQREPRVERYALFQDDMVCSKNLRAYLDYCNLEDKTYWNLYNNSRSHFQVPPPKDYIGWYPSNQLGVGAVGLVLSKQAVVDLFSCKIFANRPQSTHGHRKIDGGILETLKTAGYKEMIHSPSLIQHIGVNSTIGNHYGQDASTFRGEDFDAIKLLDEKKNSEAQREQQRSLPPNYHTLAREYVGKWDIGNGATYFFLRGDGSALKVPSTNGKWGLLAEGIEIVWDDGWRDQIVGQSTKIAYAPGESKVSNSQPARKCS